MCCIPPVLARRRFGFVRTSEFRYFFGRRLETLMSSARHTASFILLVLAILFAIVGFAGARGQVGWTFLDGKLENNIGSVLVVFEIKRWNFGTVAGYIDFTGQIVSSTTTDFSGKTTQAYNSNDQCSESYCDKWCVRFRRAPRVSAAD